MSELLKVKESLRVDFGALQAETATSLGGILDRVRQAIGDALASIDVTVVPKDDFLDLVGQAYDQFIAPIDLPGPDTLIDPVLKQLVLSIAGRMYDRVAQKS